MTGHYFVGRVPATAHRQAYDGHARDRLRRLSARLVDATHQAPTEPAPRDRVR